MRSTTCRSAVLCKSISIIFPYPLPLGYCTMRAFLPPIQSLFPFEYSCGSSHFVSWNIKILSSSPTLQKTKATSPMLSTLPRNTTIREQFLPRILSRTLPVCCIIFIYEYISEVVSMEWWECMNIIMHKPQYPIETTKLNHSQSTRNSPRSTAQCPPRFRSRSSPPRTS